MPHYCFLTGLYSRYDVLMFARQGKSLVDAGYKVTYIVCDDKPNEVKDGIEILSTRYKPKNRIDRFLNTKKAVMKLALKVDADIYQISDPEMIVLVSKFKRKGKAVVFNLREFYPDMISKKSYIPKIFRRMVSKLYTVMMKHYFKKYDTIFTVTDWVLDIIKNQYNIKNSYVLTNFPRVNKDYSLSYEEYLKRGNVLCYEGTIYSSSRQENVFRALESIPQVTYLLAGKFDEHYDGIKTLAYFNKVEFIDGFKLEDLPGILAKASICNVFRDFENRDGSLGVLKVFESMEAALPVLFADVPLYRSINEKYCCGICVNPNDVSDIESAIRFLVENKQEAYEMGQRGRQAVIEEYNWEKQASQYLSIVGTILG
jgi:glycosyltransferase involved in cell wall biosynthesis